jgi:hypothetical protein
MSDLLPHVCVHQVLLGPPTRCHVPRLGRHDSGCVVVYAVAESEAYYCAGSRDVP